MKASKKKNNRSGGEVLQTQLKKGVLALCVLSIIDEKDAYGYEIYQKVNNVVGISESTIYPILRKFVKEGYCNTYLGESNEGQPCKYFTITQEGKTQIIKMRGEWHEFVLMINKILRKG